MAKYLNFDVKKREQLRKRYEQALKNNEEVFSFDGADFVTSYAKYLLEHLDGVFGE